jgi:predicted dehydrogenase
MSDKSSTSRRDFLGKQAALAALSTAIAHGREPKFTPKANTRVLGANDRINVGFIGNGMQFHALLDRAFHARKKGANDFEYAAVCDVWQPRADYAQKQTGAAKTYRDYREVLSRPDIDAVVIAVPDHWHFLIASQALHSGKDVYLEKPMTYTVPEAAKLNDIVNSTKRVLQVGGTGPSTPLYWKINEYIRSGKLGKVVWGLISYNRNTREGMWDYPIPGVGSDHWPDAKVDAGAGGNLDWDMWLGPAPKRKYSHERYFRWRKYWDYSGGNATDLLYHRLGMMSTMIGFDFPTRVVGAGGIYVQKNREVPDTYMTLIEYPGEYAVNMVSCMTNQTSVPMTVYGKWGTLQVNEGQMAGNAMGDQRRGDPPPRRGVQTATVRAERQFLNEFKEANDGKTEVTIESERGKDLVDDWLDCIRSRATPVYNVQRGYQVMVAIALGVESYKTGRVMAFDPASKRVLTAPPKHPEYLPQDA